MMPQSDGTGLVRALGVREAIAIVVGGIIGSGIFMSPSIVAREAGAPGLSLLVWVAAGGLALCGALCYAELSAAFPQTGGTYRFLREAYPSPMVAFLFGWAFFFVDGTGAVATLATTFGTYAGYFLGHVIPYGVIEIKAAAISCIAIATVANYLGVRSGGHVQNVFTALKVLTLTVLVVSCFALGHGSTTHFVPIVPAGKGALDVASGFGTGMVAALFAYAGWSYTSYVAGEIRDPQRTVPRSILIGMAVVLVIYLSVNVAFLYVLPFKRLATSSLVAADATRQALGPAGGGLIAAGVMISTFGAINAVTLIYPRLGFAMARDGYFFAALGRVHPRFHTPGNAILVQGAVAAAFCIMGSFEQILEYYAFIDFLFFSLAVAAVIVLRVRRPTLPRPFRVWGYPVTPVLFLVVSGWYLVNLFLRRPTESMVGLVIMTVGVPFYFHWRRTRPRDATPEAA